MMQSIVICHIELGGIKILVVQFRFAVDMR